MALATPLHRAAFLIALCLPAAWYVARTSSWFYAGHLVRRDPANYESALRREPNDPHLHSIAGLNKFSEGDWEGALLHFRKATEQDPSNARGWLDLAMVYQVILRPSDQEEALHRALAAEPRTPQVAWEVGNFELVRENTSAGFAQLRTVIESDPYLAPAAISAVWRFSRDYQTVANLLPSRAEPWEELLRLMIAENDIAHAQQAWESLIRLKGGLTTSTAVAFTNYLIDQQDYTRAESAWRQFTSVRGFAGHVRKDDLVVNGGFDEDVLNGGFDWRYDFVPGAEISLDTGAAHDGSRALLISYTEGAQGEPRLYQLVPVKPETEYEVSGYLRGEEIYTSNGPSLSVADAKSGTPYYTSEPLIGTTSWTQVTGSFKTSGQTRLLRVGVSRKWVSVIRGRLWVDEVSLVQK